MVPGADDRRLVDTVIYDELCRGVVREQSRREYERVVAALVDEGCEAVVLGCTEIEELLLDPSRSSRRRAALASTRLHSRGRRRPGARPMTARTIVVAAVAFVRDGQVLTVRKRGTTRFMLVGGKPEPGESTYDAAVRETREEVGLDVSTPGPGHWASTC